MDQAICFAPSAEARAIVMHDPCAMYYIYQLYDEPTNNVMIDHQEYYNCAAARLLLARLRLASRSQQR